MAFGIVAPDGRQAMIEHAAQFMEARIPFIFDPGQGLPMFGAEELARFIDQATWVAVNDYEWQMLQQKTGLTAAQVAAKVDALIVTRGAEGIEHLHQGTDVDGSCVHTSSRGRSHRLRRCLPCWSNPRVVAWFGFGDHRPDRFIDGFDEDRLARTARIHHFTKLEFDRRYQDHFG